MTEKRHQLNNDKRNRNSATYSILSHLQKRKKEGTMNNEKENERRSSGAIPWNGFIGGTNESEQEPERTEAAGGIFSDTYKSIENSGKNSPLSWEEENFPPPREEEAAPDPVNLPEWDGTASGDFYNPAQKYNTAPETTTPPPVVDALPEEAAPASDLKEQEAREALENHFRSHPNDVSPDYREAAIKSLLNSSNMAEFMKTAFEEQVNQYAAQEGIQTGFENLDGYTGGIDPALYVIGAGTGLGKTTFCLQMADNIAASGRDVIYIALEQTPFELAAKSISRLAAQISGNKTAEDGNIITSKKIRKKAVSEGMKPIYEQAKERYSREIAPHMNIIHFPFHTGATQIIEAVESWRENRKAYIGAEALPVVFVDYLQVLDAPETTPKNADRRRQVDDIMFSFKAYSEKMPVFIISSLNRSNYTARIDYEAFKESGNIEYTGEVIFGLQLKCINDEKMFDSTTDTSAGQKRKKIQDEMEKDPREIELICLKNRYGSRFGNRRRACFKYYPACDLFEVDYDHFIPHMKSYTGGGKPRL